MALDQPEEPPYLSIPPATANPKRGWGWGSRAPLWIERSAHGVCNAPLCSNSGHRPKWHPRALASWRRI